MGYMQSILRIVRLCCGWKLDYAGVVLRPLLKFLVGFQGLSLRVQVPNEKVSTQNHNYDA